MSVDEGLYAWVEECLGGISPGNPSDARRASRPKHVEPLGRLSLRRMMGGATLYVDGIIFAIMVDGELWLKSDAEADAVWDAQGCERFSVTFKDGRIDTMNYRRAPTDVYDDPDEMRRWAALALEAGSRRPVKKRAPRRRT